MSKTNGVSLRLELDRLQELDRMYGVLCGMYEPEHEHGELLYAHIVTMKQRLRLLVFKECEKNTINLNDAEALAMRQLWTGQVYVPGASLWSAVVTRAIVEVIDKHLVGLRTKQRQLS